MKHSRAFTHDEYRAVGLPYCHLLPFTESHQRDKHTTYYDFRSADWKEWCDYVARSHCAELAADPHLIRLLLQRLPLLDSPTAGQCLARENGQAPEGR